MPTAKAGPSAAIDKKALRAAARLRRTGLANVLFSRALAEHGDALRVKAGAIVAGYRARGDEADPRLLLEDLAGHGARIAYPRVVARGMPLHFHLVPGGESLRPGRFGIEEPLAHWPQVCPDLVLVPLLAFDRRGYRLGSGGGYYDRTLAGLTQARAIGIAYAGQEIPELPVAPHDIRLYAVLNEKGLRVFPS